MLSKGLRSLLWGLTPCLLGAQIALDGRVVYGEALVSTEHITGESLPVRRKAGDEVPAGALNHDGLLVVRASRPAAESTPARIARLTQHAQACTSGDQAEIVSHRKALAAFQAGKAPLALLAYS